MAIDTLNNEPRIECAKAVTAGETALFKQWKEIMNNEDVITAIKNLIVTVEELSPDPEFRDEYNIDSILEDARNAVIFLRGNDNG